VSGLLSTSSTDPPAHRVAPAPEASADGLLEVGRIMKAHGLRGEVVVDALSNRPERFAAGSVLHADGRPLVVESGRPHQQRWLVLFAGISDRTTAERMRGTTLRGAPLGELPADEYWVHELIGRRVATVDGEPVGAIAAVEANPASDLLVLDNGRLVPSVFITEITADTVVVDPPAGLFDL
jgi:16S rRNA processing protein RimM